MTGGAGMIELDLSGLKCPLPVLRTRKALRNLAPGAGLVVTCTDPMSAIDIPNLVRQEGDRVEAQERLAEAVRFTIRRMPRPA
ncbi:sulfurtransferase TusA family protein [Methylobacterium planeticum]|uniref:Sulfurtransferase TusA family protein n=1 Tax=Methylobacterium planeticum TaxID=2615211 RepID=A0A6N6MU65_9HYPH|nr:sulfurtransferase TusA family protein [Methylobacterium planeticum]KAB1075210.1 sulfurtransferase TusA family protein [Methylobacterium planeticum]